MSKKKFFQKHIILIILVSFILTNFIHELELYQYFSKLSQIDLDFILSTNQADSKGNCQIVQHLFAFSLENCQKYKIGDHIRAVGTPLRGIDKQFNGQIGLKIQTITQLSKCDVSGKCIFYSILSFISQIRSHIEQQFKHFLPPIDSNLAIGFLLGGDRGIDPTVKANLKTIGMIHVISASGYNVGLVTGVSEGMLGKLPWRKWSRILIISCLLFYLVISGFTRPLLRATIMRLGSLLGSQVFLRKYQPMYWLLLSTALLLAFQPLWFFQLDLQLSFAATLGILLFSHKELHLKGFFSIAKIFIESLWMSICAQAFSLPLLFYYFQEFSPSSLIANTFLLWMTPLITILALFTAMLCFIFPPILAIVSVILWLLLEMFIRGVSFFATFSFTPLNVSAFPVWGIALWWLCLLLLHFSRKKELEP